MAANFLSCTLQDEIHTHITGLVLRKFKHLTLATILEVNRSEKITQIVGFIKKATLINTFLITCYPLKM